MNIGPKTTVVLAILIVILVIVASHNIPQSIKYDRLQEENIVNIRKWEHLEFANQMLEQKMIEMSTLELADTAIFCMGIHELIKKGNKEKLLQVIEGRMAHTHNDYVMWVVSVERNESIRRQFKENTLYAALTVMGDLKSYMEDNTVEMWNEVK